MNRDGTQADNGDQQPLSEQEHAFISDFQSFVSSLTSATKRIVRKGRSYEEYYIRLIQISGLTPPPTLAEAIELYRDNNVNIRPTKGPVNKRKTRQ
uniref:Uncharacterized protein n=1 Tax=Clandestinovirus TaxID=2831644 RepID=A0A8F8PK33_9VIRU|nr:hypothetical protein KOM_12_66 [Clandestinovirus]